MIGFPYGVSRHLSGTSHVKGQDLTSLIPEDLLLELERRFPHPKVSQADFRDPAGLLHRGAQASVVDFLRAQWQRQQEEETHELAR